MRKFRSLVVPVLAGAAILALSATMIPPASASMRSSLLQGPEIVNVNVSFNSQVPLADTSDDSIANTRRGVVTLSNCSRVNFWGQPLLKRQRLRSAIRSLLGCETGVMFFGKSNGVGR